jgi:3-oxoacyl-[acyl-carrier protein] reductase
MDDVALRHGSLDVLVNNAGMTRPGTFLTQTDEDWNLVIDTNLKGPFVCSQIAVRHMKAAGGGAIVNIGSVSAHGIRSGPPAYAAAKAGLEGLTRNAAIDLGRDGIRVNLIVLGTIESEWLLQRKTEEELREIRSSTLTGRLGTPRDVASVVSFLVSEDAAHVTGQLFSVSGGQWLP